MKCARPEDDPGTSSGALLRAREPGATKVALVRHSASLIAVIGVSRSPSGDPHPLTGIV